MGSNENQHTVQCTLSLSHFILFSHLDTFGSNNYNCRTPKLDSATESHSGDGVHHKSMILALVRGPPPKLSSARLGSKRQSDSSCTMMY